MLKSSLDKLSVETSGSSMRRSQREVNDDVSGLTLSDSNTIRVNKREKKSNSEALSLLVGNSTKTTAVMESASKEIHHQLKILKTNLKITLLQNEITCLEKKQRIKTMR